ncbi:MULTISPECIES: hypothetical protein [unclassified Amycolatopsis]|uniref:hypothetical protein n=1 Tax=unclassified Amycolatopsis TaxID=2618356 RepID=UPI00106DD313|nr:MULTISPECIES: hypothetical protein [unclassified Amycolatopsis]
MNPDLLAFVTQYQDGLRADADQRRLARHKPPSTPKDSPRQRLGWWLMTVGLRLATPKSREGLLEGI